MVVWEDETAVQTLPVTQTTSTDNGLHQYICPQ